MSVTHWLLQIKKFAALPNIMLLYVVEHCPICAAMSCLLCSTGRMLFAMCVPHYDVPVGYVLLYRSGRIICYGATQCYATTVACFYAAQLMP